MSDSDFFDFNKMIHEQEVIALSLVGKSYMFEDREVEIFGAYGSGSDMFFLIKWLDTGHFFSQTFYDTITIFGVD